MISIEEIRNWLHFNFHYLGSPPWDKNQSPPELIEFIQSHPPGFALDMGCGTGKNCLTLAEAGWKTTGIDFVPKAIFLAKRRFKKSSFQGDFFLGDVTRINLPDSHYDLVLDMGCYHVIPESSRNAYRSILQKALKPGGNFLLFGHFDSKFKPNSRRLTEYCIDQFKKMYILERSEEGMDRRGRNGVWLWFKKPGG
jgi:SAM-dependent methyltransferase